MGIMKILGTIIWHVLYLGFISAILTLLLGGLLTLTVVASPIGLGLIEFGKFLVLPFHYSMISKEDLNIKQNEIWEIYSKIILVLYLPIGIIMFMLGILAVIIAFVTIIGIPVGIIVAKSLGTYLNPVNKKCVLNYEIAEELKRIK